MEENTNHEYVGEPRSFAQVQKIIHNVVRRGFSHLKKFVVITNSSTSLGLNWFVTCLDFTICEKKQDVGITVFEPCKGDAVYFLDELPRLGYTVHRRQNVKEVDSWTSGYRCLWIVVKIFLDKFETPFNLVDIPPMNSTFIQEVQYFLSRPNAKTQDVTEPLFDDYVSEEEEEVDGSPKAKVAKVPTLEDIQKSLQEDLDFLNNSGKHEEQLPTNSQVVLEPTLCEIQAHDAIFGPPSVGRRRRPNPKKAVTSIDDLD